MSENAFGIVLFCAGVLFGVIAALTALTDLHRTALIENNTGYYHRTTGEFTLVKLEKLEKEGK